jgi:hypothetical protein
VSCRIYIERAGTSDYRTGQDDGRKLRPRGSSYEGGAASKDIAARSEARPGSGTVYARQPHHHQAPAAKPTTRPPARERPWPADNVR